MARRPAKKKDGVEIVHVKARRLITLAEDHGIWSGNGNLLAVGPAEHWEDALVRLRPPSSADEVRIESVRKLALMAGASRVKIEARRKAVVPNKSHVKVVDRKKSSARAVVLALVDESNSADKIVLSEIVERVMSEEGL